MLLIFTARDESLTSPSYLAVVKLLLEHNAVVKVRVVTGETVLSMGAAYRHKKGVSRLKPETLDLVEAAMLKEDAAGVEWCVLTLHRWRAF